MVFIIYINNAGYEVLNLTPHAINYCPEKRSNPFMSFDSVGSIRLSRVEEKKPIKIALVQDPDQDCPQRVGPIKDTFYQARPFSGYTLEGVSVEDLVGKALIVSMPVAEYLRSSNAPDWAASCVIMSPNTDPDSVIRDERGQIKGVQNFHIY